MRITRGTATREGATVGDRGDSHGPGAGTGSGSADVPNVDVGLTERISQAIKVIAAAGTGVASGIRLSVGTDSMHGLLPFEIQRLVEWGASPRDALLAATRWAAECCRIEDRAGSVEAGKPADLITVAGNPLEDITAVERTRLVMKGGQRFDREATARI